MSVRGPDGLCVEGGRSNLLLSDILVISFNAYRLLHKRRLLRRATLLAPLRSAMTEDGSPT